MNKAIYEGFPQIYTKGLNTTVANNMADSIFASPAGALERQLVGIESSPLGAVTAYLVVPIAVPVASVPEPETGGQFELKQNFPNPVSANTSIPFTLANGGRITLELYNTKGERVLALPASPFSAGSHMIRLDRSSMLKDLPAGNDLYQFTCENEHGRFSQCKVMTLTK